MSEKDSKWEPKKNILNEIKKSDKDEDKKEK